MLMMATPILPSVRCRNMVVWNKSTWKPNTLEFVTPMDLAAKGLAITIPFVWKVVIWHFVSAPIAQKNIVLFVVEMVSLMIQSASLEELLVSRKQTSPLLKMHLAVSFHYKSFKNFKKLYILF